MFQCAVVDLGGLDPNAFNQQSEQDITDPFVNPNPFAAIDCDTIPVTYSTDIINIFSTLPQNAASNPMPNQTCISLGCHTGFSPEADLSLDTSENGADTLTSLTYRLKKHAALDNINVFRSSLLLAALSEQAGGMGQLHPGGTFFENADDPNFQKLYCWLKEGLPNDADTNAFNFGQDIYPLFGIRLCDQCHPNSGSISLGENFPPRLVYEHLLFDQDDDGFTPVIPNNGDMSPVVLNPSGDFGLGRDNGENHVQRRWTNAQEEALINWINNGAPAD